MINSLQDKDIKLLRMFHIIARTKSFATAAIELNISQSAISTRMAELETRIGSRLCERGHGHFKLTNRGKRVLKASEELFSALDIFITDIQEYDGEITGEFHIGLIDNSVTLDDPRIRNAISHFTRIAPLVSIKPFIGHSLELEKRVINEQLECAIGLFYHKSEQLIFDPLFDEEHLLYCSNSSDLFGIEDNRINRNILKKTPYVSWDHSEKFLEWEPPYDFNIRTSSPFIEGIVYLILSGRYIGYLPTHYAEPWVRKNELRPIKPKITSRKIKFNLIRRKNSHTSRIMKHFIRTIEIQT